MCQHASLVENFIDLLTTYKCGWTNPRPRSRIECSDSLPVDTWGIQRNLWEILGLRPTPALQIVVTQVGCSIYQPEKNDS